MMMRTLKTLAIATTLLLGGPLHAQGLELRLESEVREKLPALPIPLRVVAINRGSSEVTLPWTVFFHVSRAGEEKFLGGDATGWQRQPSVPDEDLNPGWDPDLRLPPGETIYADFPVQGDCGNPSFFRNVFMWPPGTYELRAVAAPNSERLEYVSGYDSLSDLIASVPNVWVSPPLTIEILEPTGADAGAWHYLRQLTERNQWLYGGLFGDDRPIVKTLNESYPTSQYALCVAIAKSRNVSLAELEALAARLRAAPQPQFMLEWVELRIAAYHRSKCWQHLLREPRDVAAAADECEQAYAHFQHLATTVKNPSVLKIVQKELASASRRQDVYDFAAKLDGDGNPVRVRPFIVCSKETGKDLVVTFGYENPAETAATLPVGASNRFSPAPEDRGQPATFLPGRHTDALTLTIKGKKKDPARDISWTLNGVTVEPSKSDPKCKKGRAGGYDGKLLGIRCAH